MKEEWPTLKDTNSCFFYQWRIDGHVMRGYSYDYYHYYVLNTPTHPSCRFMHERFLSKLESETSFLCRRPIPAQQHFTIKRKPQMQHWTETHHNNTAQS